MSEHDQDQPQQYVVVYLSQTLPSNEGHEISVVAGNLVEYDCDQVTILVGTLSTTTLTLSYSHLIVTDDIAEVLPFVSATPGFADYSMQASELIGDEDDLED